MALVHKGGLCVFEIKLPSGLYHTAQPRWPDIHSPHLLEDSLCTAITYKPAQPWHWLRHEEVLLKM